MQNRSYILGLGILGLSFLMPSHFPPWMSWHSEAVAFVALMVLAWQSVIARYIQDAAYRFPLPFLVLPLLVFFGIAALQWSVGSIPWSGHVVVVFFYATLSAICLAAGFSEYYFSAVPPADAKPKDLLEVLAWCLLGVAAFSVFVAVSQAFNLWESAAWIVRMPNWRRPGGNLAQPNHLATLLVMGIASAVFLQVRARWSAITAVCVVLFLSAGLATTESRTGLLSALALLAWWLWKQHVVAPQASRWGAAGLSAVLVVMFVMWPTVFNAVHMMGDARIENRLNSMSNSRFEIWSQLGEAALQKPWWGWGINQTAHAHNAVADRYGASAPFTFSHNLVLDLTLWIGLPLTVLFVVLAAIWTWRRAKATRDIVPWYGLALALPVAVHSMLEYPFAYAYFLVPVMLGLGAAEGALGGGIWMRLRLKPVVGILLITTGLMAWSAVEYIKAEEDFRVVRFEMLRLGQTPSTYERPEMILMTQLGALLDSIRLPLKTDMTAPDLELLRTVALNYPLATTEYRYAMALALNGNTAEAARQLQVIRAQHSDTNYLNFCRQMKHGLKYSKISWTPDCTVLKRKN